jgi:diguanylate cyclase (GGDEF)-like protein/PAS domain S-box-containing protein
MNRRRFALVAAVFVALTVASVLMSFVLVEVQSAVRASVAAGGHWAKAQREASFLLYRYGQTGDRDYLRRFHEATQAIMGARAARIELSKPDYEPSVAAAGLLAAGNHPDDVGRLVRLFRWSRKFAESQRILRFWSQGDALMLEMQGVARDLKAEIESASPSGIRIGELLVQVERLDQEVGPLEAACTETLGTAARRVSSQLIAVAAAIVVLLISIGTYLALRTLRSIRESETQYRTLMQSASAGLVVTDLASNRILEVNRRAEEMTRRAAGELIGTSYPALFEAPDAVDPGQGPAPILRLRNATGVATEVDVASSPIAWYGRQARLVVIHDLSERLRTERHLRLATKAIENMSEAVVITDERFRILSTNAAFRAITGYPGAEVVGQRPPFLHDGGTCRHRALLRALRQDGRWQGELDSRRRDGRSFPMLLSVSAVREDHGRVSHFVGIFTDNSASRDYEQRLRHMAEHDTLTGLANRATFEDHGARMMDRLRRAGGEAGLLFVDLDGFKLINDHHGHAAGDHVLAVVAQRIRAILPDDALAARVGGDEFNLMLARGPEDPQLAGFARALLRLVADPIPFEGRQMFLSASIGIAFHPTDAADFDTLSSCADMAMYEAKGRGRNNFQVFSRGVSVAARTRQQMMNALREAIDQDQFRLHYQPQVDLGTSRVVGFEALLRWNHPILGVVPPATFIPLAEEMGIIDSISNWVLATCCRQGAAWRALGLDDLRLSVNLSPRNFWDRDLPERVAAALADSGFVASALCLEITEGTLVSGEDPQSALARLRALGVRIAIDDFGVGYSSLGYLRRFPVDVLKIDRSFTSGIPHDRDNVALVRTILSLARGLDLTVVAEGVETESQRDLLIAEGCRLGQGYLFGHPEPAASVERRLLGLPPQPQDEIRLLVV